MVTIPPRALLIDMDGTLIDTEPLIVAIMQETTQALLGQAIEPAQARRYIGPPLGETMIHLAGGDVELGKQMVTYYRDLYIQRHLDISLFDGIEQMVRDLQAAGVRLAVATSKPEDRALELLQHLGIIDAFDHVCGAPPDDGPGSEKPMIVGRALDALGLKNSPDEVLMLGDRRFDVEGAAQWGVKTILAMWSHLADESEQALAWRLAFTPASATAIVVGEQR